MKIVFTDKINLGAIHLNKIKDLVSLRVWNDIPSEEEIIERIRDAEVITANWVDITPTIIDSASNLKHIIVPSVGYEWVDTKYARKKGINVINCPTHNTQAVAEHTLALMFAISRKIVESNTDLINGEWKQDNIIGVELGGKKVTLIGKGNIGSKTNELLKNIGMHVSIVDSKTSADQLDEMISTADFVVLNVPLNKKTKYMINARRLSLMKSTSYLINTSRGAVVDQKALEDALKNNQIAGAGLDVFENEPLPAESDDKLLEIVRLPNVVATPHIGFNTKETAFRLGSELIKNIQAIINDKPLNVVNLY